MICIRFLKFLVEKYNNGLFGGEKMSEHENPRLDIGSKGNYLYFTLPMVLNYQRNSYTLWECANNLYRDYPELFECRDVMQMPGENLGDSYAI